MLGSDMLNTGCRCVCIFACCHSWCWMCIALPFTTIRLAMCWRCPGFWLGDIIGCMLCNRQALSHVSHDVLTGRAHLFRSPRCARKVSQSIPGFVRDRVARVKHVVQHLFGTCGDYRRRCVVVSWLNICRISSFCVMFLQYEKYDEERWWAGALSTCRFLCIMFLKANPFPQVFIQRARVCVVLYHYDVFFSLFFISVFRVNALQSFEKTFV